MPTNFWGKRDNLIIWKEGENDETSTYSVEELSVLFILTGKPQSVQAMRIWLQQDENVPYYRWTISADTILDYWISGDVLDKSVTPR